MLTRKPSSRVLILTIVVALMAIAAVWLWVWPALHSTDTPYPPTKTAQDNSESDQPKSHATTTYEYTSAKGEIIKITGLAKGDTITSPLVITGEVRGGWSFEGAFPIDLSYGGEDLIGIAEANGTLSGNWMTSDYVSFSATLTFTPPPDSTSGVLILHNANPSGAPENDDSVAVLVNF